MTNPRQNLPLAHREPEPPIVGSPSSVPFSPGVSEPTFYRWKKQFVGMGMPEIRWLEQLDDENGMIGPHRVVQG
nr:hypothetical protein [Methylobacterium sp. J-048]